MFSIRTSPAAKKQEAVGNLFGNVPDGFLISRHPQCVYSRSDM